MCPPAAADPGQAAGRPSVLRRALDHLRHAPRLLDDPGGLRSRLAERGLGVEAYWNHFVGWKASGGGETDAAQSGSVDFFLRVDLEAAGLWRGGEALLHTKSLYNRNVNPDVDALSDPIDDADFDENLYVSELWLEQSVWDDRVTLRAGYLEAQTLFDRNALANSEDRQFFSTFLDNDPLVPLPTGLGAALVLRPDPRVALLLGASDADGRAQRPGFDTAFDDAESLNGYLELDVFAALPGPHGPLAGTWRFGVLHDGRAKAPAGGGDPERGHLGAYASLDQQLFREGSGTEEGLAAFFRVGWADEDTSPVELFLSGGLVYRGLLPGRPADVTGAAVYRTIPSDRFRAASGSELARETGLEVYHSIQVTPWLALTPDLQVVIDPGGRESAPDALVLALRVRVTL